MQSTIRLLLIGLALLKILSVGESRECEQGVVLYEPAEEGSGSFANKTEVDCADNITNCYQTAGNITVGDVTYSFDAYTCGAVPCDGLNDELNVYFNNALEQVNIDLAEDREIECEVPTVVEKSTTAESPTTNGGDDDVTEATTPSGASQLASNVSFFLLTLVLFKTFLS